MKRTRTPTDKPKDASVIITGDWHLREDTPVCRTDDFWEAQWKKVMYVKHLQKTMECPVLHAGDLFEHWKPSPYLLSQTMKYLPEKFYTILGNHDLPQHNLDLVYKTGIATLEEAERITVLSETHWLQSPEKYSLLFPTTPERKVLLWHVITYKGKLPWPGCTDPVAHSLLKKYPDMDLIVTGHNHQRFVEEYRGRLLVNPGSITRQAADQDTHIPAVYLWYAETNEVKEVILPYEEGVISREHLERIEKRDSRIEAFISRLDLDGDWQTGVSFEENLERFLSMNRIHASVTEVLRKAVERER